MDRRAFWLRIFSGWLGLVGCGSAAELADIRGAGFARSLKAYRVYVGTYTGSGSKGIYRLRLDAETGELTEEGVTEGIKNPSFVAIHPRGHWLYAVSEITGFDGKATGGVIAFRIDRKTGDLQRLNAQPSGGSGPCHLSVDRTGRNVVVANYGGGSVSAIPIEKDGSLAEPTCVVRHSGSSVNPQRQEKPHAHSITMAPDNRFAFAADLGTDQVLIYRFDAARGMLTTNEPVFGAVPAGSGPRHFAFHPNGKFAYAINELLSTVTVFTYDAEKGSLQTLQTTGTLPADFKGDNWTADIHVHPSGDFVFGSNRGHNSIAIFRVDKQTGLLTFLHTEPTQGKIPRNFVLDPSGNLLLAANQDSDSIVVFRVDLETGKLSPTSYRLQVPKPVCLKLIPIVEFP